MFLSNLEMYMGFELWLSVAFVDLLYECRTHKLEVWQVAI